MKSADFAYSTAYLCTIGRIRDRIEHQQLYWCEFADVSTLCCKLHVWRSRRACRRMFLLRFVWLSVDTKTPTSKVKVGAYFPKVKEEIRVPWKSWRWNRYCRRCRVQEEKRRGSVQALLGHRAHLRPPDNTSDAAKSSIILNNGVLLPGPLKRQLHWGVLKTELPSWGNRPAK